MPILNIRDLGSVGVNSDIASWELPPGALDSGTNIRLSNGKIQSVGGVSSVGPSLPESIGHVRATLNWGNSSRWIALSGEGIYVLESGSWVDITGPASFSGLDESLWTTCQIGRVTFMNHPDYYPLYWVDDSDSPPYTISPAALLPWDIDDSLTIRTWEEVGMSCECLRSHKNFLMAMGMNEPDGTFRDKVWWSHPAEPDGIPLTWIPTAYRRDSIAGWVNLGRGGAIVGGESLRDSFVIYSDDAINVLDYVGDQLGWRRRSVSGSANLMSREGLVEVKGVQYFIARDDIMVFDGNSMQSIAHKRIKTRLSANVNTSRREKSWAVHYESFNEIWFALPSSGFDFPNVAYVYNYRDDTWGFRMLEKETIHSAYGDSPDGGGSAWEDMSSNWDEERGTWAMAGDSPFAGALIGASDRYIWDLDPGVSTYDESTTAYDAAVSGFDDWDTNGEINPVLIGWTSADGDEYAELSLAPLFNISVSPTEYVTVSVGGEFRWSSQAPVKTGGIRIYWNGVLEEDLSIPLPQSGIRSLYDATFQVPAGDGGTLRVEPYGEGVIRASLRDASVIKLGERDPTVIGRSDLPIGGHDVNTTITRIYPLIEGSSPVQIRVGSAQRAGGPIRWAGGYRTFTPGVDRKIDVRTTGETHAYEIISTGRAFFDLTGMDVEYSVAGAR